MRRRTMLQLLAGVALLSPARAAADPDRLYGRVVSDVIVPGFAALAAAAAQHAADWSAACGGPSPQDLEPLRPSFHRVADAWARVEMIASGPGSEEFRHERFYYWPERKNAVERGLAKLRTAEGSITPALVRQDSAAVQGLPALERLLFADDGTDADACRLGAAIAANAAALAAEMSDGWAQHAPAGGEAARAALVTDLVTFYEVIKARKIEPVLGKTEEDASPRAAEFWRSGRSLRDMALNYEALHGINAILFESPPEDSSLPATTDSAAALIASLDGELGQIAKGPERRDLILLKDSAEAAEYRARVELPLVLGVTVGFNSLDGD